jgi:hypothetical protein
MCIYFSREMLLPAECRLDRYSLNAPPDLISRFTWLTDRAQTFMHHKARYDALPHQGMNTEFYEVMATIAPPVQTTCPLMLRCDRPGCLGMIDGTN